MNYFIEGLQGSGKSTLVKKMCDRHPECKVFREGDYSPVELAWCAYTTRDAYRAILDKYAEIKKDIIAKSYEEDGHIIICYTQIITDIPGFHKYLEQYEIYNNRVSQEYNSDQACKLEYGRKYIRMFSIPEYRRGYDPVSKCFRCGDYCILQRDQKSSGQT